MAMSTSDSQCKCTLALERGGSVALACTTSVFVYVPNFYPGRHAPFVREATTKNLGLSPNKAGSDERGPEC